MIVAVAVAVAAVVLTQVAAVQDVKEPVFLFKAQEVPAMLVMVKVDTSSANRTV